MGQQASSARELGDGIHSLRAALSEVDAQKKAVACSNAAEIVIVVRKPYAVGVGLFFFFTLYVHGDVTSRRGLMLGTPVPDRREGMQYLQYLQDLQLFGHYGITTLQYCSHVQGKRPKGDTTPRVDDVEKEES
ncbi:hypothetical protein GGR53DRAFT_525202 [Hypoxylon sp. FL1150]|nr:hypothetical protein GGR53DRAFT_525202 [Hypoxylon sp. FL1150]